MDLLTRKIILRISTHVPDSLPPKYDMLASGSPTAEEDSADAAAVSAVTATDEVSRSDAEDLVPDSGEKYQRFN